MTRREQRIIGIDMPHVKMEGCEAGGVIRGYARIGMTSSCEVTRTRSLQTERLDQQQPKPRVLRQVV